MNLGVPIERLTQKYDTSTKGLVPGPAVTEVGLMLIEAVVGVKSQFKDRKLSVYLVSKEMKMC